MVDCKWNGSSRVSLGQKYESGFGLDGNHLRHRGEGHLQGPVTYEVEANGGYLAVGKLTGKLEKKGRMRGRGAKSPITNPHLKSNPQSLIPNPFVIRTPTATVTDLGTEFGVEVSKDGVTNTHVFVGEVRIATGNGQGNSGRQMRVISAGQSARVGHNEAISVGREDGAESAKRFARIMPGRSVPGDEYAKFVLSMNPAVYYRMESGRRGRTRTRTYWSILRLAAIMAVLHQDRGFRPRVAAAGSAAQLDLHGEGVGDYAIVTDYPQTNTANFPVSAWVWAMSMPRSSYLPIVQSYWRRPKDRGQFFLLLTTHHVRVAKRPSGFWQLGVVWHRRNVHIIQL